MEVTELSVELARIIASLAAPFAMFGTVVLILRWFKTDTADMIKIYSESTKAQIDAIKEDVKAIKEDVRDFHNRLCSIEEKNKGKYYD
jgi:hypothetical protein